MVAPSARRVPQGETRFGITLQDDFAWLKNKENPETLAYLQAENAFTQNEMEPLQGLQDKLYAEMLGRIQETDLSVPFKKGNFQYYYRTEEGKAYAIWCRRPIGGGEEQVILDENALAEGREFFQLGDWQVSPDESVLAYSVDFDGSEQYFIYFRNLQSGQEMGMEISGTGGSFEWAKDGRYLLYVVLDEAHRPYKVFRHAFLGSTPDVEIFHEADDSFFLSLSKSQDESYFFVELGSITTSECWYLPTTDPCGAFSLISPRQKEHEYSVEHHEGYFYFRTNHLALDFRLMKAPVGASSPEAWSEVFAGKEGEPLDGFWVFKDYLVLLKRTQGQRKILTLNLRNLEIRETHFEEEVYSVTSGTNAEYESHSFRFQYNSLTTPATVFDLDLPTLGRSLLKQKVVPNYEPGQYESCRVFAPSHDGTLVPMSLLYKKGMKLDGANPVFLYGYGSYGVIEEPHFNSNRFSLVDRGFVYAMAHLRGGGTLGRKWYEEGKFLKKKNTFLDFIACAEFLQKEGWTCPEKTCIMGGSAGGLLIGAAINLKPEIFQAAIAHVPFVDVMNTMLDPTLPLTVIEYEEWGNPEEEAFFRYMHSYSPYENSRPSPYPHLLITGGLNDPRVGYWEPAKWCAKLRTFWKGDKTLLLKTNMEAGHQGKSGRYEAIREVAFDFAFLLDKVGIGD